MGEDEIGVEESMNSDLIIGVDELAGRTNDGKVGRNIVFSDEEQIGKTHKQGYEDTGADDQRPNHRGGILGAGDEEGNFQTVFEKSEE